MNETSIAILAASAALIAATGAQVMAHIYASRRAKKDWDSKVYQEFIFPFISKVLLYYDTETNFRKLHDVEKEIDKNNLVDEIAKKVSYGNLKLLSCYYEIERADHFFDGRGGTKDRNILRFLFWYLDYSIKVIKNIEKYDNTLLKEIQTKQKLYGIWILVSEELDMVESDSVIEFMKYDFDYYDLLKEFDMALIEELIESEVALDERRINFLNVIINHIEKENSDHYLVKLLREHYKTQYKNNFVHAEH